MADYLSREAMVKNLTSSLEQHSGEGDPCTHLVIRQFIKYVEDFPAADAQPVKHGRWIRTDKSMGVETAYACSECGYQVRESDRTNYCGDCGSKLDIIYQDDKVTAIKVTGW